MIQKFQILNFKLKIIFVFLTFAFLLLTLLSLSPKPHNINPRVLAAGSECQIDASANARASGLISIGADSALTGTFGNPSGICAFDPKAAFISYKLPTYAELKSKFFDQSKTSKVTFSNPLPAIADQTVYYTSGNLNISSNPAGSGTAVIFIDGNLDITNNLTYGTATTGLVFVVKGNVYIYGGIRTVNATIISQGQIFTGSLTQGTSCIKNSTEVSDLTINGSLISLDGAKPIVFCRTLTDNSTPGEIINHQSKYVVILKDLFSSPLQKWAEVAGVPYIPVQLPTPTPTPAPPQTPVQTGISGTKQGPFNWSSNSMGFRFTPTSSGQITKLWSYTVSGTTRTVKLYTDAGTLITSAPITGNGTWASADITPVSVTAGTPYKVVVYPTSNGYYYQPMTPTPLPQTIGSITINSTGFVTGDSAAINTPTDTIYGIVDITFVPN